MASGSSIGNGEQGMTRDLAAIKEEMDDIVAQFQWFVNLLGTTMDTPKLREELQNRWVHAQRLARETSILLQESSHLDGHLKDNTKAMNEAKLAQEFIAIAGRFNEAQLLAAQRQPPFVPKLDLHIPSSYRFPGSPKDSEVESLLERSKRMLALLQDCENTLGEAITEGNEEEVQQLQAQIDTLREILKDQTYLIVESGLDIDDISSRIENSATVSSAEKSRILRDVKARRPNSFLDCVCRIVGSCFSIGS
ncbi:syntaxin-22-like isoform X2 [Punica granatum]|uniref:Uncharacterized protein n=2 Tax=Punica granatum TaxID=22663 RepID=A0A2I0IMW4_PUNGR|nr:syntaxin-22-like isoform X2 [Punica granatum]PKI45358.1 hypothetical protein CRG98_034162 [Punica granatum]